MKELELTQTWPMSKEGKEEENHETGKGRKAWRKTAAGENMRRHLNVKNKGRWEEEGPLTQCEPTSERRKGLPRQGEEKRPLLKNPTMTWPG